MFASEAPRNSSGTGCGGCMKGFWRLPCGGEPEGNGEADGVEFAERSGLGVCCGDVGVRGAGGLKAPALREGCSVCDAGSEVGVEDAELAG